MPLLEPSLERRSSTNASWSSGIALLIALHVPALAVAQVAESNLSPRVEAAATVGWGGLIDSDSFLGSGISGGGTVSLRLSPKLGVEFAIDRLATHRDFGSDVHWKDTTTLFAGNLSYGFSQARVQPFFKIGFGSGRRQSTRRVPTYTAVSGPPGLIRGPDEVHEGTTTATTLGLGTGAKVFVTRAFSIGPEFKLFLAPFLWQGSVRMGYGWGHVTASPPKAIGPGDLSASRARRFDLFGGYSHVEPGHGVAASLDLNKSRHVGLAVDWDMHGWTYESRRFPDGGYVSEQEVVLLFLSVGPRFVVIRQGRISAFGTITLDVQNSRRGALTIVNPAYPDYHGQSESRSSAWGLGVGGGADLDINERLAARIVQINYSLGGFGEGPGVQFRLKTGVVFKFGPLSR